MHSNNPHVVKIIVGNKIDKVITMQLILFVRKAKDR